MTIDSIVSRCDFPACYCYELSIIYKNWRAREYSYKFSSIALLFHLASLVVVVVVVVTLLSLFSVASARNDYYKKLTFSLLSQCLYKRFAFIFNARSRNEMTLMS